MLSVAVKTEDSRCGDSDSDSDGSGDHDEAEILQSAKRDEFQIKTVKMTLFGVAKLQCWHRIKHTQHTWSAVQCIVCSEMMKESD